MDMSEAPSIPDDLTSCRAVIAAQQATIDEQHSQIDKLRHELELFKRYLFGQRRERFVEDPRQEKLFAMDDAGAIDQSPAAEVEDSPAPSRRRRGHGRRQLPDSLPRRRIIHEMSEAERCCPCCGKLRVKVSEEISEQLEFQPAAFYVNEHVRYIYACQDEDCTASVVTAPKPPQPIDKGLAGPGMLAFVATSKLAEHLPLNRLEDVTCRYGVHIARSTQCDWMAACARLVRPLYELMVRRTIASKVLGTDDTTVPVRDDGLDRTRTAYFWAYVGDHEHPYVCYDFTTSHARDGPQKFLHGFRGYLQADAYSGYIEIALASKGKIKHAGCWAHARRYYHRARDKAPTQAVHEALAYIQRLYDVEDEAAELTSADRLQLRQEKSAGILNGFNQWLQQQAAAVLPQSALGEAISYTRKQWHSLSLFLEDGDIPLDNNRTEHALRQQVLGRVNWLFVGSDRGGETAAVLYSLVATCKRLRIDPFAYLRDVFALLPEITTDDQLQDLLPDRWSDGHPESRLAHRDKQASQAKQRRRQRRARRRELDQANAT